MATADRMHGVTAREYTEGIRSISDIATNIIGMVCTADDADATVFPLNIPVLCTSAYQVLTKAGTTGTLAKALDAVVDQADARVIIVRVSAATDSATLKSNVIAGVQKLRQATAYTGYAPKIIGAPELDSIDVIAELAAVAQALNGFAYASIGHVATLDEAFAVRQGFGQRELMLIDNDLLAFNPATQKSESAATIARILGLRAKLDDQIGWHKSISNGEINGVSALALPRTFLLMDKNSDANTLNNHDITTLIRENGFRVWGNRTCSAEPMFAFEAAVRSAQIVKETIASSFLWAMDKPMHPSLLRDIAFGINAKLADYVRRGYLLGGRVYIDPAMNSGAQVQNGIFRFDYEITTVPPLENIELAQHITDTFIVNLVDKTVKLASEMQPTTV